METQQESKNIRVPIKDIVMASIEKNGTDIAVDWINLLRQYFIAGLNVGLFDLDDLTPLVDRFTERIKEVQFFFENGADRYIIKDDKLILFESMTETLPDTSMMSFYKAVTEVVLGFDEKEHCSLVNGISEMIAERIYYMDQEERRLILPDLKTEEVCGKTLDLRDGYHRDSLLITLLKQFFMLYEVFETVFFKELFSRGAKEVLPKLYDTDDKKVLLATLDSIYSASQKRILQNKCNPRELDLIEKYQIYINALFDKKTPVYRAFCALITSNDLRFRCTKWEDEE